LNDDNNLLGNNKFLHDNVDWPHPRPLSGREGRSWWGD
jgi:hypothetical protein